MSHSVRPRRLDLGISFCTVGQSGSSPRKLQWFYLVEVEILKWAKAMRKNAWIGSRLSHEHTLQHKWYYQLLTSNSIHLLSLVPQFCKLNFGKYYEHFCVKIYNCLSLLVIIFNQFIGWKKGSPTTLITHCTLPKSIPTEKQVPFLRGDYKAASKWVLTISSVILEERHE